MKKLKKYFVTLETLLFLLLFFSMYSVVGGEETETELVENQQNNLVVKASSGGMVSIIDENGTHNVENEGGFLYEPGTTVDIEIIPEYGCYIESITLNGDRKDDYDLENIYECISELTIMNEVCELEIVFEKYVSPGAYASGDIVTITKGEKYEYNGYYTNEYWIHADGYRFLGSCAEPKKDGPDGQSFTATKISDPIFRYLMWCYQSDDFRQEAFGSVEEDEQFILLHTTLGYYYCGEQGFGEMENSGKYWIERADAVLNWVRKVFYGSDEARYVKARTAARYMFDIYIAWGGENYQDIVWVQPKEVDISISKRSAADLVSGENYLSGGIFELYAWDGSSYSQQVSTSVDNGDGTYTFQGVQYMSAAEGKFLIKEVMAPTGYELPYYFYNAADESDYHTYGGREFLLDKSYLTWSCNSTSSYEDTSAGFTFYNSPQKIIFPYSIRIQKTNENGTVLEGAEFTLFSDSTCTRVITKSVTNQNGMITIPDLVYGTTYYLKETMAPQGYKLPEQIATYEIKAETSSEDGRLNFWVNGAKYTEDNTDVTQSIYLSGDASDKVLNIKAVNHIGMMLPETGSGVTLLCFVVGITLMSTVLGLGMGNKIKNRKCKKESR